MQGCSLTKFIFRQKPFAFLNDELALFGKQPLVAFLEADAAITFRDFTQLGNFDTEFESTTVTITMVSLEF